MKHLKQATDYFLLFLLLVILLTCWQAKNYIYHFGVNLDMSWVTGLNWASQKGLQWGKDIAFTFGPLYKLMCPLLGYSSFMKINCLNNVVTILSASLIGFLFYLKARNKLQMLGLCCVVLLLLALLLPSSPDLLTLLAIFLIQTFIIEAEQKKQVSLFFLGIVVVILTLSQYIKVSYILSAWFIMVCLTLFFIYCKQYLHIMWMLAFYTMSSLVLWKASGQNILNLPDFFYYSILLSTGYTEAMQVSIIAVQDGLYLLIFATICFCLYYVCFLVCIRRRNWLCFFNVILLPAPYLLLTLKEAFVRSDGHILHFVAQIPFIAMYFMYVMFYSRDWQNGMHVTKKDQVAIGVLLLLIFLGIGGHIQQYPLKFYPRNGLMEIFQSYRRQEIDFQEQKMAAQAQNPLPQYILDQISPTDKVDIIPWEIALLRAYDMNWHPRPVFQSYSAYTPELDELNANFYYGENSPDTIMHSLMSIDGRYPVFDEPKTLRALLTNYTAQPRMSDNILILKKSRNFSNKEIQLNFIGEKHVRTGELVRIPESKGFVFAEIDWDMTLGGRIANLFFKTMLFRDPTTFSFHLSNGEVRTHRYVRALGENGVFVSAYINNISDIFKFFNKDLPQNVTGFVLDGFVPFYKQNYTVKFYELDLDTIPVPCYMEASTGLNTQPGVYQLFYDLGNGFREADSSICTITNPTDKVKFALPEGIESVIHYRLDLPPEYQVTRLFSIKIRKIDGKLAELNHADILKNSVERNDINITQYKESLVLQPSGGDPFLSFNFPID